MQDPSASYKKKEVKFVFDQRCLHAFELLKKKLIEAPILTAPNWDLSFELMCYATNTTVGQW